MPLDHKVQCEIEGEGYERWKKLGTKIVVQYGGEAEKKKKASFSKMAASFFSLSSYAVSIAKSEFSVLGWGRSGIG